MVGENGYPVTPDWLPESRCPDGCPESAVPHNLRTRLRPALNEAIGTWDRDWAHWSGDDS